MVRKKYLYIAVSIVAVGLLLFFIFYESEEDKVKKQFEIVSESVEKQIGENPIVGAGKLKKLSAVLTDPCEVKIPLYKLSRSFSTRELTSYALIRKTRFAELSLDFHDIRVVFPEPEIARVTLTAVLKGTLTAGDSIEEFHELACSLKKKDDIWRINEVRAVEVLEK